MISSIKTNPLNDSQFLNPTVNSSGRKTEPRYQSLRVMNFLLSCGVSLLFGFSTVSIASQPQQIAQTTSSEGINRPTLQVGSKGERVTELQAALKLLGFYTGTVDGEYNESTVIAVSRFQEAAGLKADGIVDTITWQRLFPGESTVASGSSPNSTSRPPLASGSSNTNQVVVPSSNSTAPASTTTNTPSATSKPEPRTVTGNTTATSTTREENSKPEPRSVTRNTTTTTRTREDDSKTEPRSVTRNTTTTTRTRENDSKTEPRSVTRNTTATTRTREDDSKTEPRSVTRNTTANSQRTYVRQSTSTRSGSTRSEQSIRTQQSSRPSSTTRTQRVASVQYTSEGLPILRIGTRGPEVVRLQRRLQRLGFLDDDEVDGNFGASTEAAVIALQKRYGLDADGVAGGGTWNILLRR